MFGVRGDSDRATGGAYGFGAALAARAASAYGGGRVKWDLRWEWCEAFYAIPTWALWLSIFLQVITLVVIVVGVFYLRKKGEQILTALDDANAAVTKLQGDVTALSAAVGVAATEIANENSTIASLQSQIVALQASGGATPAQLETIATTLGTVSTNIEAQTAALTAAATPPASPAPTPAAPSGSTQSSS
jgi:methyl-accepting chemotaxis protein